MTSRPKCKEFSICYGFSCVLPFLSLDKARIYFTCSEWWHVDCG